MKPRLEKFIKIQVFELQLAPGKDSITGPSPRTAALAFVLLLHLLNSSNSHAFKLSFLILVTTTLQHFGNVLTHIFGGQTVVSVGQGARNC